MATSPPIRLQFLVWVHDDADDLLEGTLDAVLTDAGLRLAQLDRHVLFIPVGSCVQDRGGGLFRVEVAGRLLELQVCSWLTHRSALARDVCAFLSGRPEALVGPYEITPDLLASALLPLLPAFIGLVLGIPAAGAIALPGLLWSVVALVLVGTGIAVVCNRAWSWKSQAWACAGLNMIAVVLVVGAFLLEGVLPPPSIPGSAWHHIRLVSDDQGIDLPGEHYHIDGGPAPPFDLLRVSGFIPVCESRSWRGRMHFVVFQTDSQHSDRWDEELPSSTEVFEDVERSLLSTFASARVHSSTNVSLSGWQGRQWVLGSGQHFLFARLYLDRDEGILVVVRGPRLTTDHPAVRRFFDSLTLPTVPTLPAGGPVRLLENRRRDRLLTLHFVQEGKAVLAGTALGQIREWRTEDGKRLPTQRSSHRSEGPPDSIACLAVSADARLHAEALEGWALRLEDRTRRQILFRLQTQDEEEPRARQVLFSQDARRLYFLDATGTVHVWDVQARRKRCSRSFPGARAMVLSPDGRRVIVAREEGIALWDEVIDRVTEMAKVELAAYHPDGRHLVCVRGGKSGMEIVVHDLREIDQERILGSVPGPVRTLAISGDGHWLASGERSGQLTLYDLATGKVHGRLSPTAWPVRRGEAMEEGVHHLTFHPNGRTLLVGAHGQVYLVEVGRLPPP